MNRNTRGWLVTPGEQAQSASFGAVEPRRNRDSLFLMARVRIGEQDHWSDVRVRNLSAGGLMAEIADSIAIGTAVELELRGIGVVSGRVAWQTEGRTGIAFDVEIDPLKARKPVGKPRGSAPAVPPMRR